MKTSCLLSLVCLCVLVQSVPALVKEIKSNTPNALFAAAVQSMTSHHRAKRCIPGGRLTYEERVEFLQSHNNYRRGVNPPASDMQFMVWHEELATMAQEWADRCVWEHGHYARDPEPFSWIGQNIYATTASTVSGSVAVTSWYNEVYDYSYTPNTCADGKVCGHYTQVVWKNSINLGCAIAECPFLSKVNFTDAYFVICNYGPGGNIVGQWPYSEGDRCSECPSGTVCDNGLCAPSPKCGTKTCVNGGTLDGETCECHCVAGYYGVNCTYGDGEDYGGDYGDDGGDDGNDGGDDGNDGGDDGNDGGDDAEDGDNDTDDGDYWFGVVWVRSAANVPKALSWLYVVVSAFLLQLVFQNN